MYVHVYQDWLERGRVEVLIPVLKLECVVQCLMQVMQVKSQDQATW